MELGLQTQSWVRDISASLSVSAMMQFLDVCNQLASSHLSSGVDDSFSWIWMTSKDFIANSTYLEFFKGQTIWHLYDPFGNTKLRSSTIFCLESGVEQVLEE
jgi:hypothetical protein